MTAPELYMVLPAFNEEANLRALFANLEEVFSTLSPLGYERQYVIVDDGSRDATSDIIREHQQHLPIALLTHSTNQGLGITIRDGLREACELASDNDIILTMDADNTHPAALIPRMVQMIAEGNDVVVASRYRPGAQVVGLNWFRRLMSTGARILFHVIFPIRGLRDYTCGFRAYRAALIKKAFALYGDSFIEYSGFHAMADILLKLRRLNPVVNEVPMILRYDLKGGASKMRIASTVLSTLKLMLKRRFQRNSPPRREQS
ncbi:MAG: glycosyltransferase family 2 protein [Planctomycetota bacterium]